MEEYLTEINQILEEIDQNKKSDKSVKKVYVLEFIKYGQYLGLINLSDICQELNRNLVEVQNVLRKQITLPYMKSEYKSKKILCFKNLNKAKREVANQTLNQYIKNFVECKRCKNMYTELTENKIYCNACGYTYDV